MRVVVTGAAGFIGSHVVDALLGGGHEVVGIDDFSTGALEFLEGASVSPSFEIHTVDLYREGTRLSEAVAGSDAVVHLAANADVRFGWEAPCRDTEQNLLATQNLLEAMRVVGVRRLLFSSTGSIYGDAPVIPTPEVCPFPIQTSLYGASKLAAEGLIQAYAEGAGFSTTLFRFVSVMGPRYTHGHVVDFMRRLRIDSEKLEILGNGAQRKSYLHVRDCVAAIVRLLDADHKCEVFNLGVNDYCTVTESATWICDRVGVHPEFVYTGGDRGWVGDSPFIFLDTAKIRETGWVPSYSIREAVEETVDFLRDNAWVLDRPTRRK